MFHLLQQLVPMVYKMEMKLGSIVAVAVRHVGSLLNIIHLEGNGVFYSVKNKIEFKYMIITFLLKVPFGQKLQRTRNVLIENKSLEQ